MIPINVIFEDEDGIKLKNKKRDMSWRDFILLLNKLSTKELEELKLK